MTENKIFFKFFEQFFKVLCPKLNVLYKIWRFFKIPFRVIKTIEEAMETNEPKYKNILNHQGNVQRNDFDSSVRIFFLFILKTVFFMSLSSLVDFDQTLLVRSKS